MASARLRAATACWARRALRNAPLLEVIWIITYVHIVSVRCPLGKRQATEDQRVGTGDRAGQALSQHTLGFSTHTGGLAKHIRFGVETSA